MAERPPEVRQAISLRSGETIINSWEGPGKNSWPDYLVLTNFRVIAVAFDYDVGEEGKYACSLDRDLRSIAPPKLEHRAREETKGFFGGIDSVRPEANFIVVGGTKWEMQEDGDQNAEAIIDEIAYARNRVIPPDAQVATSGGAEAQVTVKEVIREVIKVRCRYCGSLNLESDTKCASCGATLGGR